MTAITVHLLNFHGLFSHTEIVLENEIDHSLYLINQWDTALDSFSNCSRYKENISQASSKYTFRIDANPNEISSRWIERYEKTLSKANLLTQNCADAAQWFLHQFANIPHPKAFSSPVSLNHLTLGLFLPSFIPIGIMLPGRIMDNAKFYVEARKNRTLINQYSSLRLAVTTAIAVLAVASCLAGIIMASIFLSGGLCMLAVGGAAIAGAISSYGLFSTTNTIAAKEFLKKDSAEFKQKKFC